MLNVTPDSFSDGGAWLDQDRAVEHGLAMAAAGADLVDVGGESTRPGAARVPTDEELRRVLPVVRDLADAGVRVSIDTTRADVAEQAVAGGAGMVNDVSGGLADPRMTQTVAELGVPYVAMHWRGPSTDMQQRARYADVVADVVTELRERRDAALAAGVHPDRLVLDPGLGFAKTADHNWALLRRLDAVAALGHPVFVGPSRKAFLGTLLADTDGVPRAPGGRDTATAAVCALAAVAGVWGVRVHDVPAALDAVAVASAWTGVGTRARQTDPSAAAADQEPAGERRRTSGGFEHSGRRMRPPVRDGG